MINLKKYSNINEWCADIVQKINQVALVACKNQSKISISLTGGTTAPLLYSYIAKNMYIDPRLSWWVGDERCVPLKHPERNEFMILEALRASPDFMESNFNSWGNLKNAEQDAQLYEEKLHHELRLTHGTFDLVFLGLGGDGHVASLFPNSAELNEQNRLCVATQKAHNGNKRVSFTLAVLNNAKNIVFLAKGKAKLEIIEKIISRDTTLPASLITAKSQEIFYLE